MEHSVIYQHGSRTLNIPDISGNVLLEWLHNQKRVATELQAPPGEIELLGHIVTKVTEMQDKYYNAIVEC